MTRIGGDSWWKKTPRITRIRANPETPNPKRETRNRFSRRVRRGAEGAEKMNAAADCADGRG